MKASCRLRAPCVAYIKVHIPITAANIMIAAGGSSAPAAFVSPVAVSSCEV